MTGPVPIPERSRGEAIVSTSRSDAIAGYLKKRGRTSSEMASFALSW